MIWVKFFKRFLGEGDTFSQVLFIMFMDTCWFSSSDVHTCFSMHIHYIPEVHNLHWQGLECLGLQSAKFRLAVFQGDEVYVCL